MHHFEFHLLDRSFDRSRFDCGVPALNSFLVMKARQGQSVRFNKTYVAILKGDADRVVQGYYSVSMGQISLSSLSEAQRKSLPRHPVPVGRIGRLAVNRTMQGSGLGAELLVNALRRIRDASRSVGAYAVVVDAKDDSAKKFYEKFGFIALADEPMSLFLPIGSIPE